MNRNLSEEQFPTTLYHRTSPENAENIRSSRYFKGSPYPGERGQVWASTHLGGQATGYGKGVVTINLPKDKRRRPAMALEDEFPSGEQHWVFQAEDIKPRWIK